MANTASKQEKGFTLIELMIVVAIIGILASLAIPMYGHYTNKTKFAEVIQATAPFKFAVELCANQAGELVKCGNNKSGVPDVFSATSPEEGYTANVTTLDNGVITATSQRIFVKKQNSFTYILTPTLQANGQITWQQSGSCREAGLC